MSKTDCFQSQIENNCFYLRPIDSCITPLKAQVPARTCKESKEEEDEAELFPSAGGKHGEVCGQQGRGGDHLWQTARPRPLPQQLFMLHVRARNLLSLSLPPQVESTVKCVDNKDEEETIESERMLRLPLIIDKKTAWIHDAIKNSLSSTVITNVPLSLYMYNIYIYI